MTNLSVFNFKTHPVRVLSHDPFNPQFVAKDVVNALGYKDRSNAIKQHCKGVVKHHPLKTKRGDVQDVRIINEPDLYRLIFGSKLESAIAFQDWVFEDVLPSIRKTGGYQLKPNPEYEPSGFTVSGIEHLALQDKVNCLQQELLNAYRDKITSIEASASVRKMRRSLSTTTVNMDKKRLDRFVAKIKDVLSHHSVLNKTQLLTLAGYQKTNKTARKLLDQGTNTHWFCVKQKNTCYYSLNPKHLMEGVSCN